MANSKTIWRGSGSAKLTITSIQTATANGHISSYAFYCSSADVSGNTLDGKSNTTTIKGATRINKSKEYTITSYLIYKHTFGNGSTTAVSNKVNNKITVHEPLNNESLNSISLNETWVWSNADSKNFTITPTFDKLSAYSYEGQYISDSTTQTLPKGSIQSSTTGNITTSSINTLTWRKTTGGSTDLGERYQNITISVKSTTNSAPSAVEIPDRTATIQVRNAVLSLSGLSNATTYGKATTYITQTVTFNPRVPYDTTLKLVDKNGQNIEGNTVSRDGSVLKLVGNTITLDASKSTNDTAAVEFDFKVRSEQSAEAKDTDIIKFIVKPVKDLYNITVVEGQTYTITDAGIGEIANATVNVGPIEVVSHSGTSITIKGKAVDRVEDWTVTITNTQGTAIRILGHTEALEDITVNINSGDYIVLGSAKFGDTFGKVASVSKPTAGTASVVSQEFRFEAYTASGPIAAGKYPVVVTGTTGATQTVQVVVTDIAVTVE